MKVFLSTSIMILVFSSYAYVTTEKKHNRGLEKRMERQLQRQSGHYGFSQKRHKSTSRRDNAQDILDLDRARKYSSDTLDAFTRNKRTLNQREFIRSTKGHSNGGYRKLTFPMQIPKKKKTTLTNKYMNHNAESATLHRTILSPWPSNAAHKLLPDPMKKRKSPYISKGRNANVSNSLSITIRRYKLSDHINDHKYAGTRKRNKVKEREASSEEGQNVAQTFDNLDDIPDSLSRGLEEGGMDLKEVNMIDNDTLSDYFHALNGNGSDRIDSNKDNDISANTQAQQQSPWDENTLPAEESGNYEFYDAINRGETPPKATKIPYIHPTKHHPRKIKVKLGSSVRTSSTSRPPKFRMPSHGDFENVFRGGMPGKYNDEEYDPGNSQYNDQQFSKGLKAQREHKSFKKPDAEREANVTTFLDGGGRSHGNVTKVVSVGSPETVKEAKEPQTSDAYAEYSNPLRFTVEKEGRDGEGMASFYPSMSSTPKRPFDNLTHHDTQFRFYSSPTPLRPTDNIRNSSIYLSRNPQVNFPSLLQAPSLVFSKQYDQVVPSTTLEGTHIKGGKISGGQISGGLIEGGQIKAGSIEGGIIKGGQVLGGRIRNGTMDGGVIANGQMLGGHLVDGRIEGGLLVGGNVLGGKILGGRVEGGNIKGGVVAGGRFRGGNMQGGLLKAGEVQGGNMRGGKVEGGILHSGNIEGGEFKFGDITGGTLKSGSMLGGELKNGSIEGGTLKGGTIEGGVLKGGVMEGGKLKGGIVLAGKIKGGIIEGGVIEGGEIGDGVVIRNGTVNATIFTTGKSIDRNQNLGGIFRQHQNSQQLELHVNKNKYNKQGMQTTSLSSDVSKGRLRLLPIGQGLANENEVNPGLNKVKPVSEAKLLPRIETLKMISTGSDKKSDDDTENKLAHEKMETRESTSQRLFEDDETSHVFRHKGRTHHVVLDGISFDIPNREFGNLIDKIRQGPKELEDLVSYFQPPNKKTHTEEINALKSKIKSSEDEFHIEPEDIEAKSTPTKTRSSFIRSEGGPEDYSSNHGNRNKDNVEYAKDKSVQDSSSDNKTFFDDIEEISLKVKDNEKLRPTYHWSLNKLIKPDRIPGSPGPAIRTHGGIKVIHGGLHLNGHDAWLGAGDFSGGCISDPDTCDDGLSFEMTLRMDKEALKYNDVNYIVDSGASTFKSKGFTLYTVHGNLRADLAIANQEYCLQIPLIVDRWQDILVTWNKSEGMKMYINCELKAHTNGDEHCIGCHAPGCHVTDANTLLMIGRPNFSPHFHCTKFDSGDISFWERRLSDDDVKTLCGIPTGAHKTLSTSPAGVVAENRQLKFPGIPLNQIPPQINSFQSYSITQPSFDRFTGLIPGASSYAQRLFSPWSAWSVCSKTCGIGVRVRRRICVNPSLFIDGRLCSGLSIQHKPCFDRVCPVFIPNMVPPFFPTPSGRPFTYNPIHPYTGLPLPGIASDQAGFTRALTVDGGYSEWSVWGTCDRSCGGGAQVRTRICNNPFPRNGGKSCRSHGPAIQVRRCNRHECPVDGGYSSWSGFTPCSKTCGSGGIQKRVRTCSNPAPGNGGKPCFGHPIQTRTCSTRRCPIDGGYSAWSPWSPCDADCGGGIMERNRFCSYPLPRFGGKDCSALGAERETRLCNLFACNE